jgi:hypothetical protein
MNATHPKKSNHMGEIFFIQRSLTMPLFPLGKSKIMASLFIFFLSSCGDTKIRVKG